MNNALFSIGQMIVAWMQNLRPARLTAPTTTTAGTDPRGEASNAPDQIVIYLSI